MKNVMAVTCRSVTRSQLRQSCEVFFCSLLMTATFTTGCMLSTLFLLDRSGELSNTRFLVVVVVFVIGINYSDMTACVTQ